MNNTDPRGHCYGYPSVLNWNGLQNAIQKYGYAITSLGIEASEKPGGWIHYIIKEDHPACLERRKHSEAPIKAPGIGAKYMPNGGELPGGWIRKVDNIGIITDGLIFIPPDQVRDLYKRTNSYWETGFITAISAIDIKYGTKATGVTLLLGSLLSELHSEQVYRNLCGTIESAVKNRNGLVIIRAPYCNYPGSNFWLDDWYFEWDNKLADTLFDLQMAPKVAKYYNGYREDNNRVYQDAQKALEYELNVCQRDIDNLVELVMKKPSDIFLEKIDQLEIKRDEIRRKITEHAMQKSDSQVELYEVAQAMEMAKHPLLSKKLPNIQRLVSLFVDKVVVYPDKIFIRFNFAPQKSGLLKCRNHKIKNSHEKSEADDSASGLHTITRKKNKINLGVDKSTPRSGGERGIRTLGWDKPSHDFQSQNLRKSAHIFLYLHLKALMNKGFTMH